VPVYIGLHIYYGCCQFEKGSNSVNLVFFLHTAVSNFWYTILTFELRLQNYVYYFILLARPACLADYIFCRCFVFIFSGRRRRHTSSHELLDGFSWLVDLCKALINSAFIWRSLKRRCHGNQFEPKQRRFRRRGVAMVTN